MMRSVRTTMHIGTRSIANPEIDMPKPNLLLIHCSSNGRPKTKRGPRGDRFRPWVIQGGALARSSPTGISSEIAFQLADVGLLFSHRNYSAFLQAGLTLLDIAYDPPNRVDPQWRG